MKIIFRLFGFVFILCFVLAAIGKHSSDSNSGQSGTDPTQQPSEVSDTNNSDASYYVADIGTERIIVDNIRGNMCQRNMSYEATAVRFVNGEFEKIGCLNPSTPSYGAKIVWEPLSGHPETEEILHDFSYEKVSKGEELAVRGSTS